jgi:hypothetical protein
MCCFSLSLDAAAPSVAGAEECRHVTLANAAAACLAWRWGLDDARRWRLDGAAAAAAAHPVATGAEEFRHVILANDSSAAACHAQAKDATAPSMNSEECCHATLAIDSSSSVLCQCASVAPTFLWASCFFISSGNPRDFEPEVCCLPLACHLLCLLRVRLFRR